MNLIPAYAQIGKVNQDTIKCYGITELKFIALSLVEGRACDTLLITANEKINLKDTVIQEKNYQLKKKSDEILVFNKLVERKDSTITTLNSKYDKEVNHHKWTKYGWAGTSFILIVTIIYQIFN